MSDLREYDFQLPSELIAQRPLANRADARLLVVDRSHQTIEHLHMRDLPNILTPADCLVLNDTRVVPARLVGRRTLTGGRWQGLFLSADENGIWRVLGKTRGRLRPGEMVTLEDRDARPAVGLKMLTRLEDGIWVARPDTDEVVWSILEQVGRVPLPPYIRGGQMESSDWKTYQTVFADKPGAVAAPTAGLHFTDSLLNTIIKNGTEVQTITLHVGLGTFQPIKVANLDEHEMHFEHALLDEEAAVQIAASKAAGGRVVAVGTTVVRTLETAAADGELAPFQGETNLFIKPPYEFKVIDAMLTNFHLPQTTLLVLARTFGGDELIRRAYDEAIERRYRFYSYGDAMLIL
jgi:S-adenosylmethionine:tRNA ribosyltransferase-isomerase